MKKLRIFFKRLVWNLMLWWRSLDKELDEEAKLIEQEREDI